MNASLQGKSPEHLQLPAHEAQGAEPTFTELFAEMGIVLDLGKKDAPAQPDLAVSQPEQSSREPSFAELFAEDGIVLDFTKSPSRVQNQRQTVESRRPRLSFESKAVRYAPRYAAAGLGVVALASSLAAGVVWVKENTRSQSAEAAEQIIDIPAPQVEPNITTPQTTPTTTETTIVQEPTTTTTEAVEAPAPFEVGHGELVGTLRIPALCENVRIYGYSDAENTEGIIGTGNALLDRLESEPVPREACETLDQREQAIEAQTGMNVVTRKEGGGIYWQPIAGHEQRWDGGYISVFPGQQGNSVIAGHGSTFSAPFADIGLLQSGDEIIFDRADGNSYTYEVILSEILPNDNYDPFLQYSHPDYKAFMTIFRCGDLDGTPGSDAARYAVRLGLVSA